MLPGSVTKWKFSAVRGCPESAAIESASIASCANDIAYTDTQFKSGYLSKSDTDKVIPEFEIHCTHTQKALNKSSQFQKEILKMSSTHPEWEQKDSPQTSRSSWLSLTVSGSNKTYFTFFSDFKRRVFSSLLFFSADVWKIISRSLVPNPSKWAHNFAVVLQFYT